MQRLRLSHQCGVGLPFGRSATGQLAAASVASCAAAGASQLKLAVLLLLWLARRQLRMLPWCGWRLLQRRPEGQLPAVVQAAAQHAAVPTSAKQQRLKAGNAYVTKTSSIAAWLKAEHCQHCHWPNIGCCQA